MRDGKTPPPTGRCSRRTWADRHGATPTHSLAEIDYLHDRFPKEIILITAKIGDDLVGGNLFTAEGPVLQVRYTATTEAGRDACATDLVVERGIALAGELGCRYFSFGTSTLDAGRELNAAAVRLQGLVRRRGRHP